MDRVLAVALALALAAFPPAARAEAPKVCFEPARPCAGFKANDLSFPLANDGKARAEQRSAPFFAVILRTAKGCTVKRAAAGEMLARVKSMNRFPGANLRGMQVIYNSP